MILLRKFTAICLICIIFISTLTGCFDAREVTEMTYVYSIGMEKGVKDKLRISIQIPTFKGSETEAAKNNMPNVTSEQSGDILTIIIDCPTFYIGINMLNTFLSREVSYMHTKYIVFSENLAKDGIGSYLTGLFRGRQIRREIFIIICKDSASEFLKKNFPTLGSSLTKKQQNLMEQSKHTGLFPEITYRDVLNSLITPYDQIIAPLAAVNTDNEFKPGEGSGKETSKLGVPYYAGQLPRQGDGLVELLGTAVFDGDKLIGELNGDETRVLLMTRDDFRQGNFTIQDPEEKDKIVTLNIKRQKKPSIKVDVSENNPIVNLHVYLEGEILAIQSAVNYEEKDLKSLLENSLKEQIKMNLEKTIKKCQGLKSDVFKFGKVAATHFLTIQDFENYKWLDKFKDANVNIQIDFTIRRTGTILKNKEIIYTEDNKNKEKKE